MNAPALPEEMGIVVALPAEAEGWGGGRCAPGRSVRVNGARVAIAGVGSERAAMAAAWLVEDGARALLSWGIAGAVSPLLRPGDLLAPHSVASQRGEWDVDAAWRAAIAAMLGAQGGGIWCSAAPVASVMQKRELAQRGMVAVDMESAAVAAVAARTGLPFAALKAICDPADRALPSRAIDLLDTDGRLCLRRLPGAVRAGPVLWRELMVLASDFAAARVSLRRAACSLATLAGAAGAGFGAAQRLAICTTERTL